jgi:hypothetical protein
VGNVAKEYKDDVILTAASQIVLYFVTSLLHASTLLQDILIQTVCNGGLGYLGVLLIQLWMVNPWLSVVTVLVGLLCLHFVFQMSSGGLSKKLSGGVSDGAIHPITSKTSIEPGQPVSPAERNVSTPPAEVGSLGIDAEDGLLLGVLSSSDDDDSDPQFLTFEGLGEDSDQSPPLSLEIAPLVESIDIESSSSDDDSTSEHFFFLNFLPLLPSDSDSEDLPFEYLRGNESGSSESSESNNSSSSSDLSMSEV